MCGGRSQAHRPHPVTLKLSSNQNPGHSVVAPSQQAWFASHKEGEGIPDHAAYYRARDQYQDVLNACESSPECRDCLKGENVMLMYQKCTQEWEEIPCHKGMKPPRESCADFSAFACCVHGGFGSPSRHCLANKMYIDYQESLMTLESFGKCTSFSCSRGAVSQSMERIIPGSSAAVCSVVVLSICFVSLFLSSGEETRQIMRRGGLTVVYAVGTGIPVVVAGILVSVLAVLPVLVCSAVLYYLCFGVHIVVRSLGCAGTCRILWSAVRSAVGAVVISIASAGILVSVAALFRAVRTTLQFGQ